MCGIAGILSLEPDRPAPALALGPMLASLVHRGPDDEGRHVDGPVAFGTRRLSIIDVEGGRQPLANEDGTVWAALNGEIYNYRELRLELESRGHRFRTHSDTETLVHLYEEHGDGLLDRLNGMYGLAVWDARRRRLLLARDRLGIKPLYYSITDRLLLFGSELKAILASGLVRTELDLAAARDYALLFYVPAPRSIVAGVLKLLPGHRLVAEAGRLDVRPYWSLPTGPTDTRPFPAQLEDFRGLFRDAVSSHLRSDVPYGAFLSGGVDSSAIVGTMAGIVGQPVKTFAIGFEGNRYYDELPYARAVATRFGTEHEEFVVKPEVFALLGEAVRFYDEPFADAAFLPSYVLSRLTRQKVKVVLTGDGGDELFAGYDRYRSEVLAEWAARIPALLRRGVLEPLLALYSGPADWRISDWVRLARKKLAAVSLPSDERYVRHFHTFEPALWDRLIGQPLRDLDVERADGRYRRLLAEAGDAGFLTQRMHLDLRTWLPDQMLTKVDRATMAHGLEARVPFLDHRVVEFAMRLPDQSKFTLRVLKRFLKEAFAGLLPASILHRRKHGFQVPLDEWLRGPLRDLARDVLSENALRAHGLFRPETVRSLLDGHESRQRNWSREIFGLMVFQMWYDFWLRSPAHSRPSSTHLQ